VAKPGTDSETYERNTWPELARLAKDVPEAGLHFQGQILQMTPSQRNTEYVTDEPQIRSSIDERKTWAPPPEIGLQS
jgi:hypothetical protein